MKEGLQLTIEKAKRALSLPRPGIEAQATMAPSPRPGWDPDRPMPVGSREGSVLILLYPRSGQLHFVLTKRPETVRFHKGQISLPGGSREKGETRLQTALRETSEELGIAAGAIEVLGKLSPIFIPPSDYTILPFVGCTPDPPAFTADPVEVIEVIEVPLSHFMDPSVRKVEYRYHPKLKVDRRIPYFDLLGHFVWGATAMMLAEFAALLETTED
ncbi:NUDIX hydrolase [Acidobacteriota bacterium]